MITLNSTTETFHEKQKKVNSTLKVDDLIQLNLNKTKLEHEQCIKWIYDGEKSYIRGYN